MKILAALSLLLIVSPVSARVFMTQEQALDLAFPGERTRHTLYLSEIQKKEIQALAKAPMEFSVLVYYTGLLSDGTPGWAFFETNVVRTEPETFMTVVDEKNTVRFVELLSFNEPDDYLPPPRWLKQFPGRTENDDLTVKRGLRNITGATLTAVSISDGVRRAVAVRKHIAARP